MSDHKTNAIFEFRDPFLTRITVFQIKTENSVFDVYDVKVTLYIVQSQSKCDFDVQRLILPLTNHFKKKYDVSIFRDFFSSEVTTRMLCWKGLRDRMLFILLDMSN